MNKNRLRILVIHTNPKIHDQFHLILNNMGRELAAREDIRPSYIIDTVFQGEEGIAYVKRSLQENIPYSLVYVNAKMDTGLDGIKTVKKIWEIDSDLEVVICIEITDSSWQTDIKKLGETDRFHILKFPFEPIEIAQIASSLTEKWALRQRIKQQVEFLNELVSEKTAELSLSLSVKEAALESTTEGILVINNNGEIIDYNQKFVNIWRLPMPILKKRTYAAFLEFLVEQVIDRENIKSIEQEAITLTQESAFYEVPLKNGTIVECYSTPYRINNEAIGRVIAFRDVTERRQVEEQLQHLATFDMLTELPNRTLLLDRIRQAITTSKRAYKLFAVLFIDIDHFKEINDTYGHSVGDKLLKEFGARLKSNIRESDTLARISGDEFVIMLTGLAEEDAVMIVLNKLIKSFTKPFHISGQEIEITASIGVSYYPRHGKTAETLLKNADIAMYRVKTTGRNNYKFYTDDMNTHIVKKLQLEVNLYRAIENEEFILQYQPIVDLKTNKIVTTQTLLRWKHPKLGIIFPKVFIPIAEEAGVMPDIIEWVLRQSCSQNKKWQEEHRIEAPIAVNLPGYQSHAIADIVRIKNILRETELSPEYLSLELTENNIISNPEPFQISLQELNAIGVGIIIDDFGMGYSYLSYLEKLPIKRLMLHHSFISLIHTSSDAAIIGAIINLAHSLKIKVIAEGVETKEQIQFLLENQCDECQGKIISPPLVAKEYEKFLASHA